MVERLIDFSIRQRIFIVLFALALIGGGIYAASVLRVDAVPDITTRQIQINAKAPALGPEDLERQVTFPLEVALASLPRRQTIRSISQFGLAQVTVVFDDDVDIYFARQLVNERVQEAKESLPPGAQVEIGPVTTGLGEVYQFTLEGARYSLM